MTKLNGKSAITRLAQPLIFVFLAASLRLIPHPANFAPIAAMALFGGAYFNKKQAYILPILAMFLSDLFLGFGNLTVRASVYGSFLISVYIGTQIKKEKSIGKIISGSLVSSVIFFIITNFAVWLTSGMYVKTVFGLVQSYILAIPFFRNTILGDMFYTGVFFGGYEFVLKFLHKPAVKLNSQE